MKILAYILAVILVLLQIQLWFGPYGALRLWSIKREVVEQNQQNEELQQRNSSLHAEVSELKTGSEALEERARSTLGMIKDGEEFYQAVPGSPDSGLPDSGLPDLEGSSEAEKLPLSRPED